MDSPAYVIDVAALERNLELWRTRKRRRMQDLARAEGFRDLVHVPARGAVSRWRRRRAARTRRGWAAKSSASRCTPIAPLSTTSLAETIRYSDHVVFNSPSQIERFRDVIDEHAGDVSFGLRINPEHSEVDVALYDPCAPGSRLGTPSYS